MSNALSELAAATKQGAKTKAESKPEPTAVQLAKPVTREDQLKSLKAVEAQLNKQFNTVNSIVRLGSRVGLPWPHISTGLPTFDIEVMNIGGVPRGRIIEVFGPESSGKTTWTLHIIAAEQENGNLAAFVDAEHGLDPNYAKKIGVDVDNLYVSQPDSGEQALETVEALIESRAVSLIVVDSVAALVPQAELDGEMGDSHMGLHARLMSQAMRKLTAKASAYGVTVIFINQIREKVGVSFGNPEVTTGGRALKFYASVRYEIRKMSKTDGGEIKSGTVLIGHRMKIKAVKNRFNAPFRETAVDLIYGVGIDKIADIAEYAVSLGVITKSGAWFDIPVGAKEPVRRQGMQQVKDLLHDDEAALTAVKAEIDKARKAQKEAEK